MCFVGAAMSVSGCGGESLRAVSGLVPDRRGARGCRLPDEALSVPGLSRAPRHATYRCFFKALDVVAAERALGLWAGGGGGDYPFTVQGNRPRPMADIAESFGDAVPPCAERGAG